MKTLSIVLATLLLTISAAQAVMPTGVVWRVVFTDTNSVLVGEATNIITRNGIATTGSVAAVQAAAAASLSTGAAAQVTASMALATGVQAQATADAALATGMAARVVADAAMQTGITAQATADASMSTGILAKAIADAAVPFSGVGSSGTNRLAIGSYAGYGATGVNFTAVGYMAGCYAQGYSWTALGDAAGFRANGGEWQACGYNAGYSVTGSQWVALGRSAGSYARGDSWISGPWAGGDGVGGSTVGDYWVAFGARAGGRSVGDSWSAIGNDSGKFNVGSYWTAYGMGSGIKNEGSYWSALGYTAGTYSTGSYWTAIGEYAGEKTAGSRWYVMGYKSGYEALWTNCLALGTHAGYRATGNNQLFIDVYPLASPPTNATDGRIWGDDAGGLNLGRPDNTVNLRGKISFANTTWVDLVAPGMSLAGGTAAPQLVDTGTGIGIQGMGYDLNDIAYGALQMPHNLALTNATRSTLHVVPHLHWSLASAASAPNTNVTWQLVWEWANIGGGFSLHGTNTVTVGEVSATNSYLTSFGNITNLAAGISSVFRFRLGRVASGADDYGSTRVVLDQFDLHVPVDRIGSASETAQ